MKNLRVFGITKLLPLKGFPAQYLLHGFRRAFVLVLCFLFGIIPARAAISACGGSTLSALAGAAGNSPSGGCGAVDVAFNGFALAGGSVGLANINLSNLSGGAITGSASINPIVAQFNSSGWVTSASGNTQTTYSIFDTRLQVLPGEQPPSLGGFWGITSLSLTLQENVLVPLSNNAANNYLEVLTQFCLGASAFTCSTTDATYGYIQQRLVFGNNVSADPTSIVNTVCTPGAGGCIVTNPTNASIGFGSVYYSTFGLRNSVTVSHVGNAGIIDLDSFRITIGQSAFDPFGNEIVVPEPSTFGLFGSALALLRIRRRFRGKARIGRDYVPLV